MKDYELYVGLYKCNNPDLEVVATKIGHSLNSMKRVRNILACLELQDVFWLGGYTRKEVRDLETQYNDVMDAISTSGGSSEFHLFSKKQWVEANKIITMILKDSKSKKISWHPNAWAFPSLTRETAFVDISIKKIPSSRRLKKEYF